MYYNYEWINDNICVHDSHDMNFKTIKVKRLFLIVHHTKNERRVNEAAQKIISANYDYISIFGEMAPIWKKAIEKFNDNKKDIEIEITKTELMQMGYDIAMYSKLYSDEKIFLVSDDEFFTEIAEDILRIIEGTATFTVEDWIKFKKGYEFNYNGRDSIVIIKKDGIYLGYLNDLRKFKSLYDLYKIDNAIFDGKSFIAIWKEVKKQNNINK